MQHGCYGSNIAGYFAKKEQCTFENEDALLSFYIYSQREGCERVSID